jgi:hypothetical protein
VIADPSTGVAGVDTVAAWCLAGAAILGIAGVVWRGARRIVHRFDELVDDWQGTPARVGVAARPGVMARLGAMEQQSAENAAALVRIEHELHPNSGTSLRDAVDRLSTDRV